MWGLHWKNRTIIGYGPHFLRKAGKRMFGSFLRVLLVSIIPQEREEEQKETGLCEFPKEYSL